jgi:hypothetical protein
MAFLLIVLLIDTNSISPKPPQSIRVSESSQPGRVILCDSKEIAIWQIEPLREYRATLHVRNHLVLRIIG